MKPAGHLPQSDPCPCGSQCRLGDCCEPFLAGKAAAPTAEALMRSRYTAYVLADEAYLLATWHAGTRPDTLVLNSKPAPQWLGLTVKNHSLQDESHATVAFIARYKINGRAHKLHETSRFVREDGRWFYVDGDITP